MHTTTKKSMIKKIYKLWPTNQLLADRDNSHDNRCKRCNSLHENWAHIFCCTSEHNIKYQSNNINEFRTFLQQFHLSKPMITCMISRIQQYINADQRNSPYPIPVNPSNLHLYSLTEIGWSNFLCGRVCKEWFLIHDQYCMNPHLPNYCSTTISGPKLILKLWNFTLSTWFHRNDF